MGNKKQILMMKNEKKGILRLFLSEIEEENIDDFIIVGKYKNTGDFFFLDSTRNSTERYTLLGQLIRELIDTKEP